MNKYEYRDTHFKTTPDITNRVDLMQKIRKMLPLTKSQDPEKMAYDQLLQGSDDGSRSSHSDDEMVPPHRRPSSKHQSVKKYTSIITKMILVCFAFWGVLNIGRRTINISIARSGTRSCSCGGTTVAEAIRRGCKFTPLAISWLPDHCLDMELAEEFDAIAPGGQWEYWADLNGTIPMTRDEISMLADTRGAVFYTTQEWHVMHCKF